MKSNSKTLKYFFSTIVYIVACVICLVFIRTYFSNNDIIKSHKGVIDFSNENYNEFNLVSLNGEWEFYQNSFLEPNDFNGNIKPDYIYVPSNWNNKFLNNKESLGYGYATYRLKVILPESNRVYGLKIDSIYSSYTIWIDGINYGSIGDVGMIKQSSKPALLNNIIYFTSKDKIIDIVIQVSNFNTIYSGIIKPLKLASAASISRYNSIKISGNVIFSVMLFVISLFFAVQYFLQKKDKKLLYFSCICIGLFFRILFINEDIFRQMWNVSNMWEIWSILTKLGCIDLVFLTWANVKFYLETIKNNQKLLVYFNKYIYIVALLITIIISVFPIGIVLRLINIIILLDFFIFYILYIFLSSYQIQEDCKFILKTIILVFTGFLVGIINSIFGIVTINDHLLLFSIIACCINSVIIVKNYAKMSVKNMNLNRHLENIVEEKTAELRMANERLHKLNKELKEEATTDSLTNLYNRRMFEVFFIKEFNNKDCSLGLSLIMFDIDFFKRVNDTFGHDIGDMVLKEVSSIVKSKLRKTDIVARWGGEEFVVLLPDTNIDAAILVAEKLRKSIEEYNFFRAGKITVSFGVIQIEQSSLSNAISLVDKRLYKAKNTGRNKVIYED